MMTLFWILIAFFSGSIPYALILGKLLARKDIRTVGDGNPGGANALKAGGMMVGVPAILLDIAKAFFPVYLAQNYGLTGWTLVLVCLAPILGHAFSPFLRFHGGKALGATAGVWLALIGPLAILIYAVLALPATIAQSEDAWSANAGMLGLLGYTVLSGEGWMVAFATLNAFLIAWTHRHALACPPQLRPWVTNILQGRHA
jgi:acyl phosphate:glycerol-3-phosphate acyltransferase